MSEAENITELKKPRGVYQMISDVTASLSKVGMSKEGVNEYDKYNFRGIDQIYNVLGPIISEVGLVIIPNVLSRSQEVRKGAKDQNLSYVVVEVKYTLCSSEDGSTVDVVIPGEAMDRSDKATTKAMSAAYKYMVFQTFCPPLEPGSVDDPDAESPEIGNSTGRVPKPVAMIAAEELGLTPQMQAVAQEYIEAISSAYDADDAHAYYELIDEMDNDMITATHGHLNREIRKQLKAWREARKGDAE